MIEPTRNTESGNKFEIPEEEPQKDPNREFNVSVYVKSSRRACSKKS